MNGGWFPVHTGLVRLPAYKEKLHSGQMNTVPCSSTGNISTNKTMNRILRIKLLVVVLFATTLGNAQEFQRSDLQNRKWICEYGKMYSLFFTDREMIMQIECRDGSVLRNPLEYYLSATNDSTFDHSLVGKSERGKYIKIYEKLERGDRTTIASIKELTDTKFVYEYEDEDDIIDKPKDEYVHYNLPIDQIPQK